MAKAKKTYSAAEKRSFKNGVLVGLQKAKSSKKSSSGKRRPY